MGERSDEIREGPGPGYRIGAGGYSLYLQEKGFAVVGIDNSPLAVEDCRARGLRSEPVPHFGNAKRAKWILRRYKRYVTPYTFTLRTAVIGLQFIFPIPPGSNR